MSEIRKIADGGAWDRLMALAEKLEPSIRDAFVRAAKAAKEAVDVKELVNLLEQGQVAAAEEAVANAASYKQVVPALQNILLSAAKEELKTASAIVRFGLHFDAYNASVVQYALEFTGKLITTITNDQRAGVRASIVEGLQNGTSIPALARTIRETVGLNAVQQRWVATYRAALEAGDLNALKRILRDARSDAKILRTFQAGEQLSAADVDRLVARYTERQIAYRGQMIARTESIEALDRGQHLAWLQAIESGKVNAEDLYSRWFVAPDERVCVICLGIVALNPEGVAFGQPFQSDEGPIDGPPAHTQCRCVVFTRPR